MKQKLINFFKSLFSWKKKDSWSDPNVFTYDSDKFEIPESILEKVKGLNVPVVKITPYIEKYPYTFLKLSEKYTDPTTWDSLFHVNKHMDFSPLLKVFFAESKLNLSVKKTMQYDPRFNAIRVASYRMMVTYKGENGDIQMVCKAQGNPLKVMPEVLEYLLDMKNEILKAEEKGGKPNIQVAEISYPMAEKECPTCKGLSISNPQNHGVCPECYTPINEIIL